MVIITGGAGFIGSCILAKFNEFGRDDIIIVDHLVKDDPKNRNLDNKNFYKYYDKAEFIDLIINDNFPHDVECIIHMGACSSTTLQDAEYFKENNLEYSVSLAQWAIKNNIRFIYASSASTYGDGSVGYKDDVDTICKCRPLNLYGKSKQDFDKWLLDNSLLDKVVGLKFFNVYGPNEYHKGDMKSVVAKAFKGVLNEGKMYLFKSYNDNYSNGGQKRDFIYIKDAVDVVMFFYNNPNVNGIFNVGTGEARTWNDLSKSLFKALDLEPNIEYFEMPEDLKERYQYFTEADMSKLRECGYKKPFTRLEDAIADYVKYLKNDQYI